MKTKKSLYDSILAEHLSNNRQMAFVSGPRQVGKTTTLETQDQQLKKWLDFQIKSPHDATNQMVTLIGRFKNIRSGKG